MKISCLIPTYNEEPRIKGILTTVAENHLIDEIIVIDDGSKDKTQQIVREISMNFPKVRLIVHEKNKGKSGAICTGIKASIGNFLMFIDADLIGVTRDNLGKLIEPVVSEKADVTISLRGNAPGLWKRIGLDYISGERVMPREFLLKQVEALPTLPKFGLESYLNSQIIKNNFRIKIVNWPNVESPWKYKKQGLIRGLWGDVIMILDIIRTISIFGPIYQIIKMKKLEVK